MSGHQDAVVGHAERDQVGKQHLEPHHPCRPAAEYDIELVDGKEHGTHQQRDGDRLPGDASDGRSRSSRQVLHVGVLVTTFSLSSAHGAARNLAEWSEAHKSASCLQARSLAGMVLMNGPMGMGAKFGEGLLYV